MMEKELELCQLAIGRRDALRDDSSTTCYRLIHSTADGFPGITVDRLDNVLLVEQHRKDADVEPLMKALERCFGADTPIFFKARWSENSKERGGFQRSGATHPGYVTVVENGLKFVTRLLDEEHIGLFLDSRKPREVVRQLARGRRVLNLFSYTGGFGVAAAAGGALSTVNIDIKTSAATFARRNYELNNLPFDDRTFFKCDVLYFLKRAAGGRGRYDLIILDPPPRFARRHQADFQMDKDYGKLLAACFKVAAPGALLMAGLNASRVSDAQFEQIVAAQAEGETGDVRCAVSSWIRPGIDFPAAEDRPAARFVLIEMKDSPSLTGFPS